MGHQYWAMLGNCKYDCIYNFKPILKNVEAPEVPFSVTPIWPLAILVVPKMALRVPENSKTTFQYKLAPITLKNPPQEPKSDLEK